jgi:hypothetical protein
MEAMEDSTLIKAVEMRTRAKSAPDTGRESLKRASPR